MPCPPRSVTRTAPVCESRSHSSPRAARQVPGLDHLPVRQRDLGPRRDVQPGLDHAVVAQRDPDAGVRADQAALTDRDRLLAATGQRAHDRRAAAHVGAVPDDHTGRDPAFHHGRAEGARVVVDEALVHDRGPLGQVGAQPDPVRVRDPHPGRQHVVHHPGELVHAVHGDRAAPAQPQPGGLEVRDRARSVAGPHHVGQRPEDAVQVAAPRADQAARQQVQAEVRVVRVRRGCGQAADGGADRDDLDPPGLVRAEQRGHVGAERLGRLGRGQPHGAAGLRGRAPVPAPGTRCPAPSRPDPLRRSPPWPGQAPRAPVA